MSGVKVSNIRIDLAFLKAKKQCQDLSWKLKNVKMSNAGRDRLAKMKLTEEESFYWEQMQENEWPTWTTLIRKSNHDTTKK